jgi:hypothetical protein
MNTLAIPVLFALVGALVYAVTTNKASTLGLYLYFCGVFWLTYLLAGRSVHFP